MAFGRKEKKNPSSRYSRIEEPWLDDDELSEKDAAYGDVRENGYGVRDSYSRQASYGRPEGYYGQDSYAQDYRRNDDSRHSGRYERYDDYDGRYDAREGRYAGQGRDYDNGYAGQGRGYDGGYGNPDDRYDGGYGNPNDRYDGEYGGYDDGYTSRDGRSDYDNGYAAKDTRHERGMRQNQGGLAAGAKKKGKTGFIVKLILLLIAAAALVLVWRVSRMKHVSLGEILTNAGVSSKDGYRDFVIYGVDSREGNLTKEAHSDTIILCSMNQNTKEIKMVSVYRDTLLDNTNGEYHKATECYYYGGPSRSVNMLNKNLDLNLQDYITVDFNAVIKAVDLVGGVDVDVTEEELPYINGYQTENAQVTGAQITPVESAGYQHLNGIQALAYCRIRYTEGWDYRRTERQRTVLSQIFSQAKSQGPVKMAQIVDTMLPYIATSFSSTELLNLATSISGYTLGDSTGFPFEQQAANVFAGDCVVPVNLAQNVSELHAYMYQQTGYTPTQTVQDISNEIANLTGIY